MTYSSSINKDDITDLLLRWQSGEREALDRLMVTLYGEFRKIAQGHLKRRYGSPTLISPTVLVNEACLKLIKNRPNEARTWKARAEFFGLVSSVMLSVLVDYAKRKKSKNNGGQFLTVTLYQETPGRSESVDLLILDDILKRLEKLDTRQCGIWKCRYLCGLSIKEIAEIFEMGQSSIHRELKAGMGWVRHHLQKGMA